MATTIPSTAKKIVTSNTNSYFLNNKITIGTAIPTTGKYAKGDIVINSTPSAESIGWICITAGSPGTWKIIKSGVDVTKIEWTNITGKPSTYAPALGVTSTTAYRGDYGNIAYEHSQSAHAPSDAQKNSDITLAEINAVLKGEISAHTHDNRYYTETETNDLLADKADVSHAHAFSEITGKPSTYTPTLGETSTTAYRGDYGKTAYNHSQSAHAPSNAQKNSDITKAEIEAKLIGTITTHNHNSTYYTKTEVDDSIEGVNTTVNTLSGRVPVTFYEDDNGELWFD